MNYTPLSSPTWQSFVADEKLTEAQAKQFQTYLHLLIEWNKRFNLTAITQPDEIIERHFRDSLSLRPFVEKHPSPTIADVGTGAGIPGIPLKIAMPDLKLILIEVNQKKISFLNEVISTLGLENVEIYPNDWRTFIRKTSYPVNLFVARASLQPKELLRIFNPSSPYNHAQLVYFASQQWQPDTHATPYIMHEERYGTGDRERRLIFFSSKQQS